VLKFIFIFSIFFINLLIGKSFVIEGEVKYDNSSILYVDYSNINKKYHSILKNEINICEKITLENKNELSFWKLSFDNNLNYFYLKNNITGKEKSIYINKDLVYVNKIHSVARKINKIFKCNNDWISKNIFKIVKKKNKKETKLVVSDLSGEFSKVLYDNNSLLIFPYSFGKFLYFTSIKNDKAYLLSLNKTNGNITKLFEEKNGYLRISQIRNDEFGGIEILFTSISNDGQININLKKDFKYEPEILNKIYKKLKFSKMLLNPKFSFDRKFLFFIAKTDDSGYDIYRLNLKTKNIRKIVNGIKILSYDINKNNDIIYKDIYNGVFNYFFYDSRTHKRFRLNTFKGDISKPTFVSEFGFVFFKSYKNSYRKNLFYYDLMNQRTIKINKKYLGFQNIFI